MNIGMKFDEIRLSICILIAHYRPELLPDFHMHTRAADKLSTFAEWMDEHFPLESESWATVQIVESPMKLLHWLEKEKANAEDLLRAPDVVVRD